MSSEASLWRGLTLWRRRWLLKTGGHFAGVLIIRALLPGVYNQASDVWKLPYVSLSRSLSLHNLMALLSS